MRGLLFFITHHAFAKEKITFMINSTSIPKSIFSILGFYHQVRMNRISCLTKFCKGNTEFFFKILSKILLLIKHPVSSYHFPDQMLIKIKDIIKSNGVEIIIEKVADVQIQIKFACPSIYVPEFLVLSFSWYGNQRV